MNRIFSFSVDQTPSACEWDEIITVHWVVRLSKQKLMRDPENREMEEIKQVDAILLDKTRMRLSRCNSSALTSTLPLPPLKLVRAKFREWGSQDEKKMLINCYTYYSTLLNITALSHLLE